MKFTPADLQAKGYRLDTSGKWVKVNTRAEDDATTRPPAEHKTQSSAGWRVQKNRLNWVEREWFAVLQANYPGAVIQPQFRVRISDFHSPGVPVFYTADYALWSVCRGMDGDYWTCDLWECKDSRRRYHSDELTRPKMARAENPWIRSVNLAVWDGEQWERRVLA